MAQRKSLLSVLLVFCAFAGPACGQTVSFLDSQGSPATVYLEGSRVFLRVEDPAANTDGLTGEAVLVLISAALSGAAQYVVLDETGPDTGVFTGSLQLQFNYAVGNGLITSRDTSTYPDTFDTLTVTYGAATDSAGTVGSIVAVLDAAGNEISSFQVGDTIYFRVRDAMRNSSPSVDTTWVNAGAIVRSWFEYETVNLTETGGDTGIFEGSISTVYGIEPTQQSGVIELEPGDLLQAEHNDANGETSSMDEATALSDLPVTIEFLEGDLGTDEPISEIHEFSSFRLRVTDGAAAGQGSIDVRVRSDLRGDEELTTLLEDGGNPGTFYGPFSISATLSSGPPALDGLLEVTEIPGPPHQFDTLRATPETCSVSPCPTDVAGVIGSSVRFLDIQGEDTLAYSAGDTVILEVRDYTAYQQTSATLVSASGDSETFSLLPIFPYTGRYRGGLPCAAGPAVPGDNVLQVQEPDTITASHPDPLGFSSSTDTATIQSIEFLDRFGNPADFQFENAWARLRTTNPGANLSPGIADTLAATLQTVDADGNVRDAEPLELTETGPDTGVFIGQKKLSVHYAPQPNDGRLDSWYKLSFSEPYSIPDDITAIVDTASATVPLLRSKIWLVDANGADATQYPAGSRIYIRLESEGANFNPAAPDTRTAVLANPSNQDIEYPLLAETGPDTSIFEGSYATNLAPAGWDGVFNVQPGHTFRAVDSGGYAPDITDEASILVPLQPNAVDDAASLAEDGPPITIPVLANDTAPAGRTLTVSAVTQGTRGAAAVQGDGTITYTPNANANGTDSFTYNLTDSLGLTDTATVAITLSVVNDTPDAVNDAASTNEDAAVTVAVLTNDSDIDGDSLSIASVTQGTRGAVVINADGTVTYTPNANVYGSDSLTYTVSDGNGGSDTATVSITISAVNDTPDAVNDAASTNEDTAVTVAVLTNDSDLDGDGLSVASVTQGSRGAVVINANGTVTYTPNANANGTDSLTYTVSDGNGGSDTATVSITIAAINDAPDAVNDAASTNEDTAVTVAVLANDSDVEGDSLSVASVTQGARGAAVINANGTITYTPNANANGTDSFTYTVSDGNGGSDTATVAITISALNDTPDAVNDAASTNEDAVVTISVRANDSDVDGDSLSVASVTQGTRGAVVINANGTITYTPNANANGSDSFTYTLSDGNGGSDTATVAITIAAVNVAPDAINDSATTNEDTAVTISVRANDSDLDGDSLTVASVTQGTRGAVVINANGTVTYTPNANANGSDSFTYTVSDGNGGSDTATVSITISAVNDAPDAVNDAASTNEDTAVTISVHANDSDPENNSLAITAVTQGAHGAVSINGNGTVTYTPGLNFNGPDAFSYSIADGNGGNDSATVNVTVSSVNDPPDAVNDAASTVEGAAVSIPVLANDTDLEGNPLSVSSIGTASNGTATNAGNGSITYTPTANFTGIATFTYTISDGSGGTDTATVTVTVRESFSRVAVLGTNSVWLRTGADVVSGDVIVNQAGAGPFLNGSVELSLGGTVTLPAGWDVQADSVTIAGGATVASDLFYNQLTNNGTVTGSQRTPLALPVFATLPTFLTATPGSTDVNVANNASQTLAAGSYRDLIVGRKATVTFTGGVYHFRTVQVDREAKIYFSAASQVRVQQKLSTKTLTTVGPATGASITAASIVFHVAGVNGTSGGLAATPKAVDVGTDNVFSANVYAPNGTVWLEDGTQTFGAFLGRDVQLGIDVQVTLQSAW